MNALQRFGQLGGLFPAGLVERPIGPSLQAMLDVPVGLAVPRDIEPEAAAGLRRAGATRARERRQQARKMAVRRVRMRITIHRGSAR